MSIERHLLVTKSQYEIFGVKAKDIQWWGLTHMKKEGNRRLTNPLAWPQRSLVPSRLMSNAETAPWWPTARMNIQHFEGYLWMMIKHKCALLQNRVHLLLTFPSDKGWGHFSAAPSRLCVGRGEGEGGGGGGGMTFMLHVTRKVADKSYRRQEPDHVMYQLHRHCPPPV